MFEYELIQQRNISGKGILKVPTDVRQNRAYILYASVFRKPKNQYLNFNYNPTRGRFGTLVFLRDGYVINSAPIEYPKQVFDGVNDISGQTLLAVKCAYDGMLESVYRLSVNLAATPGSFGLTPVNYTNLIADYVSLRLAWDECRLVCYADTAIQLSLYRLLYDVCNPSFDADIPTPTPDPIPEIPAGEPIEGIDPAYDDEIDDGSTIPYPGDSPPTPPPLICTLTFEVRRSDIPTFVDYASFIVPNSTYNNVSISITGSGGGRYTYIGVSTGDQGTITVYPGGDPLNEVTITFSNPEVTCV